MKQRYLAWMFGAIISAAMLPAQAEGLDSPRNIDGISPDQKTGEFVMTLKVPDNWKDHAYTFGRVDRKLEGYTDFIERGPIKKLNSAGKPIRIDIVLAHKPDAKAKKYFDEKRKMLKAKKLGMRLDVAEAK